jgi:hypothetical protein
MVSPLFGLGVAALRGDSQTLARELFGYFTRPIESAIPGLGMSVRAVARALEINESTLRSAMTRGTGVPSEALANRIIEGTRAVMATPATPDVAQRLAQMTPAELERAARGAGATDVMSVGMRNTRTGDRTRTTTAPQPVLSEAVLPHQLAPDTQSFRVIVETSPDDRTRAAAQGRTRSYEFKSLRRKTLAVDYDSYVSGLQDAGVNVIGIIEYGAGGNVSRTDLRDQ